MPKLRIPKEAASVSSPVVICWAYAGIPSSTPTATPSEPSAFDSQPRHWTTDQVQQLGDLAASVVKEKRLPQAASHQ